MGSAAGLNQFSPYKNFPFQRPCRIKYRALRLVRLRYRLYSSAYRRFSRAMTALILVAAIRLAPFPGGGLAPALVQVLFPRPRGRPRIGKRAPKSDSYLFRYTGYGEGSRRVGGKSCAGGTMPRCSPCWLLFACFLAALLPRLCKGPVCRPTMD